MAIRFSIEPDPAEAGKPLKICYDFDGLSIPEAKATVDWRPISIPDDEVTLTPAAPCATVTVPGGATGGFLIDTTGNSGDLGFFVS